MRRRSLLLGLVLAVACRRKETPAPSVPPPEVATEAAAEDRVKAVFPHGVATEDARGEIGTAPAPPDGSEPDPAAEIVVSVDLATPATATLIKTATASPPTQTLVITRAMDASSAWHYVDEPASMGPFTRVAISILFVDVDGPESATDLDRAVAWARAALAKLDAKPAAVSMTTPDAVARATTAFKLLSEIADPQLDVGVRIAAPPGKKFPGRLVWDAAYAAGFTWGDGDYFHWVPSPRADVGQGIGIGTSTGASYFLPEWVAKNDGSADVDDLDMSFSIARVASPDAVFEVMLRAAKYMARRLGGALTEPDGAPFDEAAARAHVTAIVQRLQAAGLTPGRGLALQVF